MVLEKSLPAGIAAGRDTHGFARVAQGLLCESESIFGFFITAQH